MLAFIHPDDLYEIARELDAEITKPRIPTDEDTERARIICERKIALYT